MAFYRTLGTVGHSHKLQFFYCHEQRDGDASDLHKNADKNSSQIFVEGGEEEAKSAQLERYFTTADYFDNLPTNCAFGQAVLFVPVTTSTMDIVNKCVPSSFFPSIRFGRSVSVRNWR